MRMEAESDLMMMEGGSLVAHDVRGAPSRDVLDVHWKAELIEGGLACPFHIDLDGIIAIRLLGVGGRVLGCDSRT